jgi:hypothetical protein
MGTDWQKVAVDRAKADAEGFAVVRANEEKQRLRKEGKLPYPLPPTPLIHPHAFRSVGFIFGLAGIIFALGGGLDSSFALVLFVCSIALVVYVSRGRVVKGLAALVLCLFGLWVVGAMGSGYITVTSTHSGSVLTLCPRPRCQAFPTRAIPLSLPF